MTQSPEGTAFRGSMRVEAPDGTTIPVAADGTDLVVPLRVAADTAKGSALTWTFRATAPLDGGATAVSEASVTVGVE